MSYRLLWERINHGISLQTGDRVVVDKSMVPSHIISLEKLTTLAGFMKSDLAASPQMIWMFSGSSTTIFSGSLQMKDSLVIVIIEHSKQVGSSFAQETNDSSKGIDAMNSSFITTRY